jgi:hypothetical protein
MQQAAKLAGDAVGDNDGAVANVDASSSQKRAGPLHVYDAWRRMLCGWRDAELLTMPYIMDKEIQASCREIQVSS